MISFRFFHSSVYQHAVITVAKSAHKKTHTYSQTSANKKNQVSECENFRHSKNKHREETMQTQHFVTMLLKSASHFNCNGGSMFIELVGLVGQYPG